MGSVIMKVGKVIHWISGFFFMLGWVVVAFMLVTTCYDVTMRYVFAKPTSWAVELNSIMLVYVGFLCAAELVRKGHHIDMDVVFIRLPAKAQKLIHLFISIVVMIFCAILAWLGGKATYTTFKYAMFTSGALHMPLWIVYIAIPLGSALIGLEYILGVFNKERAGTSAS